MKKTIINKNIFSVMIIAYSHIAISCADTQSESRMKTSNKKFSIMKTVDFHYVLDFKIIEVESFIVPEFKSVMVTEFHPASKCFIFDSNGVAREVSEEEMINSVTDRGKYKEVYGEYISRNNGKVLVKPEVNFMIDNFIANKIESNPLKVVLGCGQDYVEFHDKKHDHSRYITFDSDAYENMLTDVKGRLEDSIHILPDISCSEIIGESMPYHVWTYPVLYRIGKALISGAEFRFKPIHIFLIGENGSNINVWEEESLGNYIPSNDLNTYMSTIGMVIKEFSYLEQSLVLFKK